MASIVRSSTRMQLLLIIKIIIAKQVVKHIQIYMGNESSTLQER